MTNSNITTRNFQPNLITQTVSPEARKIVDSQSVMMFQTNFAGTIEMYSDEETVANYLNDHQGWFINCAEPMKVTPFGSNGYTLTIGNYGAFGYYLEPQMSVILELPESKCYSMYSVANPQFTNSPYEVNYRSDLQLESISVHEASKGVIKAYRKKGLTQLPEQITRINWLLDLSVEIEFPSFIYRLPVSIIQSTGSRVLSQIVKQISPRLSCKVQKDFHNRLELPMPPNDSRSCHMIQR